MTSSLEASVSEAIELLQQGRLIAYPCEAVYGLGCDPFNPRAVDALYALKQRPHSHGFILVAADWQQLQPWLLPQSDAVMQPVLASWPGPETWVLPAAPSVPAWLLGQQASLAVRVSDHPTVRQLTKQFGLLISTSANRHGQAPLTTATAVAQAFAAELAAVVPGKVGKLAKPTRIRDALTHATLR